MLLPDQFVRTRGMKVTNEAATRQVLTHNLSIITRNPFFLATEPLRTRCGHCFFSQEIGTLARAECFSASCSGAGGSSKKGCIT